VAEVQNVQCDATGGAFGLAIDGETAYISHNADANDIKESLEALSLIEEVSILFNNGKRLPVHHLTAHLLETFQSHLNH